MDYYKILQVDRSAKEADLKEAFIKLAKKLVLGENTNDKREVEVKLKEISEAYNVLSDPQKRAVYDQMPLPDAGEGASFRFNPRSADDIFSEFFGSSSPSGGMGDKGGGARAGSSRSVFGDDRPRFNPRSADDIFSDFFGFSSPSGGMGDKGGGARAGSSRSVFGEDIFTSFRNAAASGEGGSGGMPRKAAAIERMLPCSLEDLYKGTTKKMKITRDVMDPSGRPSTMEEILTIEIKPGWKKGTKITFEEKGNEQRGLIPSDLVFIIDEKPHNVFRRDGNDLVVTQKISLVEALAGYTVRVTTLDGRNLTTRVNGIISPTYEGVIKGEGMPISKEPGKKGDLRIKFNTNQVP